MSDTTPRPDDTSTDPTAPPPPRPEAFGTEPTEVVPPPEEVAAHDAPPPPPPAYPAPPQAQQAFGQQPPPQAFPPPPPPLPQPYSGGANPMTPQDEKTTGMAAHGVTLAATVLSGGTLGFLCALVMYLVFRDRGPFVRHHSANALNVQIIAGIVMLISIPLMFVLVGFLSFAAAWVFAVIVHIIGAVKANNGEWWTPPLTPQFVK